jgi:hypothetical protein
MTPRQETAALRDFDPANDRYGSFTTEARKSQTPMHVRFAPKAGIIWFTPAGNFWRMPPSPPRAVHSITSSARSREGIVLFRRLLWCSTCVIVGSTPAVDV